MARKAKTNKTPQTALSFDRPVTPQASRSVEPETTPAPAQPVIPPARPRPVREAWIMSIWKFLVDLTGVSSALATPPTDDASPNALRSLSEYWRFVLDTIDGKGEFARVGECATWAEVAAMREGPTASFREDPHAGAKETMFRVAAAILRWRARNTDGDAPLPVMRLVKNLVARSTERAVLDVRPMPADESLVTRVRRTA